MYWPTDSLMGGSPISSLVMGGRRAFSVATTGDLEDLEPRRDSRLCLQVEANLSVQVVTKATDPGCRCLASRISIPTAQGGIPRRRRRWCHLCDSHSLYMEYPDNLVTGSLRFRILLLSCRLPDR